ncbi:hypothetical protein [Paracoccus sp. S3-43]|uniref:hypothetical protein n=1 Tax=Paracoccus sp. S3-43 TaxID=3030011 RepID=UPI0023B0D757|nr:hypothetical protein [Paracoccus sp. S3-43]WEF24629.1 hypothetical protein PXD02_01260 [Paracoccus sp. S3-43]
MSEEDQRFEIDRKPSPTAEAESFESPDERRDARAKGHELQLLLVQQGPVGRLIGCSDPSLTIALILLVFLFVLLIGAMIGSYAAPTVFGDHVGKLITAILTIAG